MRSRIDRRIRRVRFREQAFVIRAFPRSSDDPLTAFRGVAPVVFPAMQRAHSLSVARWTAKIVSAEFTHALSVAALVRRV